MATGKQGGSAVAVSIDDGPGGTLRVITPYVREIGGISINAISEETHPFGVAWKETTPVGLAEVKNIVIKGKWDNTVTVGPHVVFIAPDDGVQDLTRTFVVGVGDSKTFTAECRLIRYDVMPAIGKVTEYEAEIQFTGTPTGWA